MPSMGSGVTSLQNNAFSALNDYVNLAQQMWNIFLRVQELKQREANHAYSVIYANTQTYNPNPDGTIGATDSTPNTSHPMVGTTTSSSQINGFVGYMVNDYYNMITGVAVTTADRRPAIMGMLS